MKKTISAFLCLMLVFLFTACGSNDGTSGASAETKTVTGEVVKAEIPSGWSIVTGTEMTGASGADFICHSEKYEMGDAYFQVTSDGRDLDRIKSVLESADTYGAYSGEAKLANGTWYIAENAAAAAVSERILLVTGYEIDFSSDEVQSILGSLQWAE
ncbi:MAG: hypothetical protein ACI4HL_04480 [Ruminococcus sp.]